MDIIGISGLAVPIAGFGLSLWQLRKTRRAAEAAATAAQETARAIHFIDTVATIHDICGRSRTLLNLAREGSLISAATAAFELRDLIARFHVTASGQALTTQNHWRTIINDVREFHERLELAAKTDSISAKDASELFNAIAQTHSLLSTFATIAADQGAHSGHP